ncbi:MAG: RNA polymerase sigma factor, partial [Planctomycetota bacterium]
MWNPFFRRYHRLVVGFAIHAGLRHDEAESVAQDTLIEFSQAFQAGRYDRSKGRLRNWLFSIAIRQLRNSRKKKMRSALRRRQFLEHARLSDLRTDEGRLAQLWKEEW